MNELIKTGLIGHPLGHSLSPLIHNYWIQKYDLSGSYQIIDILPEELEIWVMDMVGLGYSGFNVTLPYKRKIMSFCETVDKVASKIGAVNTVVIDEDGLLHGSNTDSFGFVQNILRDDDGDKRDFKNASALVLGAGGAARGVVHGLLSMGVRSIKVANRTQKKAEHLAASFPVEIVDWDSRETSAEGVSILVNTTSLGMEGQPELEFDMQHLPSSALVCDIVYKPLETGLLKNAKLRGNEVVTGIGMLLHQARPAFQEWFGVMPEITDELQKKVMDALV